MDKEHKLTLRLRESNPRQLAALNKIENSGMSKQEYLLHAVLAYEADSTVSVDMESIVAEVIRQIDEKGYIIGSTSNRNSAHRKNEFTGDNQNGM